MVLLAEKNGCGAGQYIDRLLGLHGVRATVLVHCDQVDQVVAGLRIFVGGGEVGAGAAIAGVPDRGCSSLREILEGCGDRLAAGDVGRSKVGLLGQDVR